MRAYLILNIFIFLASNIFALDYYWIGGTGNWSDINHWATTSGGTILHTTVPSSTDDVYFDANSFNTTGAVVTLDVQNAFCRDLNWTGAANNPTFQFQIPNQYNGDILRIFGDLSFIPNMTVNVGRIIFEGFAGAPKQVQTGNNPLRTIRFSELNQRWELADTLKADYLVVESGELKTNNNFVDVGCLDQTTQNTLVEFDSSIVKLSYKDTWVRFNINNYPFNAGNSTIIFAANANSHNLSINGSNQVFHKVIFEDSISTHYLGNNNNFSWVYSKGNLEARSDTLDTLIIDPGKKLMIYNGVTAVQSLFGFNGTCAKPIFIEGETSGSPTLHFNPGAISLNYLSTKNINYTGGPWIATNSFDLGNNTGITIIQPAVSNLYWVGGTGNWSDVNHWAFTSGGPGGACLPNARTNVIFDVNSFISASDTVKIDINDAYCRDFTWLPGVTGNPLLKETFAAKNQNLHVYGDFTLAPTMDYDFIGFLWFESDTVGNTINTNTVELSSQIYFNNQTGEWSLQNNLATKGNNYFIQNRAGLLKTHGFELNIHSIRTYFPQLPNTFRKFNFSDSKIRLYGDWSELQYTDSINLKADSAHILLHGNNRIRFGKTFVSTVEIIDTLYEKYISGGHFNKLIIRGNIEQISFATDSLLLLPGSSYQISNEINQPFDILQYIGANAPCDNPILLYSQESQYGNIEVAPPVTQNINNLHVSEITNHGPSISLPNSFDLGGNSGFTFPANLGRTLYWVGNSGSWFNDTCWSLSSGGLGGNCIPTAFDTVIFNQNSFSAPNQEVQHQGKTMMAHTQIWGNVQPNSRFAPNGKIWNFGDLLMDNTTSTNFQNSFYFKTLSALDTNLINIRNRRLENIYLFNQGVLLFKDSIQFNTLYQYKGTAVLDSTFLFGGHFRMLGNDSASLFLSHMTFDGWRFLNDKSNLFLSDNSSIISVREIFRSSTPFLNFNKVILTGQPSWSNSDFYTNRNTINKAEFLYNARILGKTEFNSIYLDDNNLYEFQHADTQRIHHLDARWNPCFPITIRSTQQGTQAHWLLPTDSIATDFMEIRDLNNAGPEPFYAGDAGVDQGNNTGIFFYRAPGFIYGFHDDSVMLACDPINFQYELRTNTFQKADSFLWHNGSKDTSFYVTQTDTMQVAAYYGTCIVRDTVAIYVDSLQTTFSPQGVISDTVLCWHDSLQVSLHKDTLNYFFEWNTGSQQQNTTYFPDSTGYLIGVVTNGGQTCIDSIFIALNDPPLHIADDSLVCSGLDSVEITAPKYAFYQWVTGDSLQNIHIFQDGTFWLKITDSLGCNKTDTFEVISPNPITKTIVIDSVICFGESNGGFSVTSVGGTGNLIYYFEDSLVSNLSMDSLFSGNYVYKVEDQNGCFVIDSVNIYQPDTLGIRLDIAEPTCYGYSNGRIEVIPTGGNPNYSINWVVLPDSFLVNQIDSGSYFFTITDKKGCIYEDSITIGHPKKIRINTTIPDSICENDEITITPLILHGNAPFTFEANGLSFSDSLPIVGIADTTLNLFAVDSSGCYSDTLIKRLQIQDELILNLPDSITLCYGNKVTLEGTTNKPNKAFDIIWDDGQTTSLTRDFFPTNASYVAELVKGCNNKKRDTTFFNYQPVPYLDVVKDLNVSCDGLKLGYEAYLEDASSSYWLLNNEQIEGDFLETTLPFGGPKNASLVGFNEGCADTLNLDLNEFNIDSLIKSYLPNVFTPNNDGKNDFFGKELKEIFPCATIEIFSRWGNPVFSNKFTEKPWNGKINNNRELVRPGTYFYVINFYEYSYKGSLTVNY